MDIKECSELDWHSFLFLLSFKLFPHWAEGYWGSVCVFVWHVLYSVTCVCVGMFIICGCAVWGSVCVMFKCLCVVYVCEV